MYYYGLLCIAFFAAFFWLRINANVFYNVALSSVSLLNDLLSKEEEEIKVQKVQKSTYQTTFSLLKVTIVCLVSMALVYTFLYAYSYIFKVSELEQDWTSFYALISISVGATVPFLIPFSKSKDGYSETSKLLHRMILNNPTLGLRLFKREVKKIDNVISNKKEFVVISGLARAGTTSLMTDLFKTGHFSSLDYANMPFLLSPNTWRKFYRPKNKELKERSHQDGVMIGLDSVEAMEEYFFKVSTEDIYIKDDTLELHDISASTYADYMAYHKLIRSSNEKLYLAKNNNFILRFEAMCKHNDKFKTFILFRDPLTQADSLLSQHVKYTQLQQETPFALEYMNWLGHHEFGLNQKQFQFGESSLISGDKFSLDYWISIWINYYKYILKIKNQQLRLIPYKEYCDHPEQVINSVLSEMDVPITSFGETAYSNMRKVDKPYSSTLLEKANAIYKELLSIK